MSGKSIDEIIVSTIEQFRMRMVDPNGRYRSWEYCYICFLDARKSHIPDYDYLSLQLAFYLASWGMYRGSSFLMKKDYKIHIKVVKMVMDEKYASLSGIKGEQYFDGNSMTKLMELKTAIEDYYETVRFSVKGKQDNKLSKTLVTKVLMGTLACTPAYDRFFVSGLKKYNLSASFNEKSILSLVNFYNDHIDAFEKERAALRVGKRKYPQMKLLDMFFWSIGQ